MYRWKHIFPGDTVRLERLLSNCHKDSQLEEKIHEKLQERLANISWFMRCLNEMIAKMANKEDNCKGRFWQGRFKSQALLDEGALLSAMVYVDLNPIRAKIAQTPEDSEFTSIQERIQDYVKSKAAGDNASSQPMDLMPFEHQTSMPASSNAINFSLEDYFSLVDTMGRFFREGKRGVIPDHLIPILERLELHSDSWFDLVNGIEDKFHYAIGNTAALMHFIPGLFSRRSKCLDFVELCYHDLAA